MSSYRSILLHVDGSPRSAKRLVLAHALAARHDAVVTALYASTPTALSLSAVLGRSAAEMLPLLQQLDLDHRDLARSMFKQAEATATRPFDWQEASGRSLVSSVAREALCHDLMILGQYDAFEPLTVGVPSDFVPSLLLASGRPALVLPYVDTAPTIGEHVLIAWKPTPESAHAVSAALPLLRDARRIDLTIANDRYIADEQAAALERFMRSHDVEAPIRRHASLSAATPGEDLLSLAADVGADLLVMGCYGHSRARELVMGGASRTVLRTMTLPVLMAH